MTTEFNITIVHHPSGLPLPINKETRSVYYIVSFTDNKPTVPSAKSRWKLYNGTPSVFTDLLIDMYNICRNKNYPILVNDNNGLVYFTISFSVDKDTARSIYEYLSVHGYEEMEVKFTT